MSEGRAIAISIACGVLSMVCMFALVALEQRDGMVARSTPLAWLLLAGGIALAVPAVTICSRVGPRDRAGRQTGASRAPSTCSSGTGSPPS